MGIRLFRDLAVLAALLPCGFGPMACKRDRLLLEHSQTTLPADGRIHFLLLRRRSGDALRAHEVVVRTAESDGTAWLSPEQADSKTVKVLFRAPVNPGQAILSIRWHGEFERVPVSLVADSQDSFADGTPDFLRLHSREDRRAFRAWVAGIAEEEAALPPGRLPREIDDCAALLRFVFREALVEHDVRWLARQELPTDLLTLRSVAQYRYPHTPLGTALFRVKPGPFLWADLRDGSFAQFADAQTLMHLNTYLLGRDLKLARPGDLLFFRQLERNSPYHSMVVTGENSTWVVYHTGPIGTETGEMRRVAVVDLLNHPDARWRPVPGNSNFLGVFRWNILREGD